MIGLGSTAMVKQLEVCGVRVRREKARFKWSTGTIAVGHQWIEFVDQNQAVTYSAGFWPSGNLWGSSGVVAIPDPYHGETDGIHSRSIEKRSAGHTCDAITACIRSQALYDLSNPPTYRLWGFNCRDWTERVLARCGLAI